LFATTADAYVILDDMPEQPETGWTADGRPLTKEFARARLARMLCADSNLFTHEDALGAASSARDAQVAQLQSAVVRISRAMADPP
jgi:uncharacterized hydantoinase/oxoprolinase family protein